MQNNAKNNEIPKVATTTFDGMPLRFFFEGEDVYFVASDALKGLELDRKALERIDENEKGVKSIHTLGGVQQMVCLTESGLYDLILGSRVSNNKPQIKAFKKWVTQEVLPAIRKTGKYEMPEAQKNNSADLVAQMEMLQKRVLSLENKLRNNDYVTESFLRVVVDGFTALADDILDNRIYPTLDKQEARLKLLEGIIEHITGIPADDAVEMVDFYLIQEGDSVWHKMGISADVPERRTALSTGNSSELRVVLTIPFYSRRLAKAFEDYMQNYFKENKKRGEWFALNQNDLLFIERLGMVYRAHYEGRWGNLPKHT
jgi:prophage antirepressor-like protein